MESEACVLQAAILSNKANQRYFIVSDELAKTFADAVANQNTRILRVSIINGKADGDLRCSYATKLTF